MQRINFKKIISMAVSIVLPLTCIIFPSVNVSAEAGNDSYGTQIEITQNYQTVDTFCGVPAKYVLGYSDTGDYCCAAYVSNFYDSIFNVTVYGINMWDGMPAVTGDNNPELREVTDVKPGDIMQTKTYDHVAIVKAVNGNDITLIEQNYKWKWNGTIYTIINRHVIKKNYHFYRLYKNGVEQTIVNSIPEQSDKLIENKPVYSQGQTLQSTQVGNSDITLKKGETDYLTSTLASTSEDPIIWESSNNQIVQVTDGKIYAANVGEATISAYNSTGRQSCTITVTDDISSVDVTVSPCYYNGKTATPKIKLVSGDKVLTNGTDYTISCESSNVGAASATITGMGYFTGSREINFTIKPAKSAKVKAAAVSSNAVKLQWNKVLGADGYIVSKYNTQQKKWERIYKGKSNKLTYNKLDSSKNYKFKVNTYKMVGKKPYYSPNAYVTFTTKPAQALFLDAQSKGKQKVKFSFYSQDGISGREIYMSNTGKTGTYKKIKTTSAKSCTLNNLGKNTLKYFKVRAYKKIDGKKIYGAFSPKLAVWVK